jgi:hypothetical protein
MKKESMPQSERSQGKNQLDSVNTSLLLLDTEPER